MTICLAMTQPSTLVLSFSKPAALPIPVHIFSTGSDSAWDEYSQLAYSECSESSKLTRGQTATIYGFKTVPNTVHTSRL